MAEKKDYKGDFIGESFDAYGRAVYGAMVEDVILRVGQEELGWGRGL